MQGTENILGSLHFCGILTAGFLIKLDMFLPMFTTSLSIIRVLCVHNSLKNLAYLGICLTASNKGICLTPPSF